MIGWHLPIYARHLPYKVDGLSPLFASAVVRRIGVTLLVFSPLYILELAENLGFPQGAGIGLSLSFFAFLFLSKLLFTPVSEWVGNRFGFRSALLFSGIPAIFFILLLILSKADLVFLFAAAAFWGMHASLFWWGYHGFFIKAGKPKAFGKEMGAAKVLDTVAMVISPLAGAFIIKLFGFSALFWIAGIMVVAGILLLIPVAERKPHRRASVREVLGLVFSHKPIALAYIGNSAEGSAQTSLWPLFLFLTLGSAVRVGGFFSAAVLTAAILTFLIGAWIDKKGEDGERKLIVLGAPFASLTWAARALFTSVPVLIFADALYRFVDTMVAIPLDVLTYQKAIKGGSDRAILFKEITGTVGAFSFNFLLAVWLFLGGGLLGAMLGAAAAALLPLTVLKLKHG